MKSLKPYFDNFIEGSSYKFHQLTCNGIQPGTERDEVLQLYHNPHMIHCEIRPEWTKRNFVFEFLSERLTERIDGFYGSVTPIEQLDESGGVSFD